MYFLNIEEFYQSFSEILQEKRQHKKGVLYSGKDLYGCLLSLRFFRPLPTEIDNMQFLSSSFEKHVPPGKWVKICSMLGSGYCSNSVTFLVVSLKSPQILIRPSCFNTGTIGALDSAVFRGSKMLSLTRWKNLIFTFSCNACGTDRFMIFQFRHFGPVSVSVPLPIQSIRISELLSKYVQWDG